MTKGIRTIEIKRRKNGLRIQAVGQTPRGQRTLKAHVDIPAKTPSDPQFKGQMEAAVFELMGEEHIDIQYPLDVDDNGS